MFLVALGMPYLLAQDSEMEVTGVMAKPFTGKIYLSYVKNRLENLDSVVLNNETEFSFKRKIANADVYRVRTRPYQFDVSILAEPGGKYKVAVDADKRPSVQVLQGKEHKLYTQYQSEKEKDFAEKSESIQRKMKEAEEKNDMSAMEQLNKESSALFEKNEARKRAYIQSIPQTFAGVVLAGELLLYTYPELREVYQCLDTVTYRETSSFRSFMQKYNEAKDKWIQNRPAPDFITHDLQGKEVRLSDFKGHYLLLDFWASWCRPCRIKAKELKKQIAELDKRGIRVCGISMDDKREQWEKATSEDGIIWTNTSELKAFKDNTIAADYKVTQLPTLFLIDPQGMIVKQNPSIEDLLQLESVK